MSNVIFGGVAGFGGRLIIIFVLLAAEIPVYCQSLWDSSPYDASRSTHGVFELFSMATDFGPANPPQRARASAGTVSADALRNPLPPKTRRALEKALRDHELGRHAVAIRRLRDALEQYPLSAPYILTVLGAELLETRGFDEAVRAFEQVARAMPRESTAHSNLGLSLALTGKIDVAEKELREALALDRANAKAAHVLEVVLVSKRMPAQ